MKTITDEIIEIATSCARAAVVQGFTAEHLTADWNMSPGDVGAIEFATGIRRLEAGDMLVARRAFEEDVRNPTPPSPGGQEDDDGTDIWSSR